MKAMELAALVTAEHPGWLLVEVDKLDPHNEEVTFLISDGELAGQRVKMASEDDYINVHESYYVSKTQTRRGKRSGG